MCIVGEEKSTSSTSSKTYNIHVHVSSLIFLTRLFIDASAVFQCKDERLSENTNNYFFHVLVN